VTDAPPRLHLIAYLRELPDEAALSLDVQYLSREQFDSFSGDEERRLGSGVWVKTIKLGGGIGAVGGVQIDLYTKEDPPVVLSFPFTRKPDLHLIRSEESV
jgi:hypothetical protein